MSNSKAIIEYLEQAKEQGYDWAQSAIDQCWTHREYVVVHSLSEAVCDFCNWRETKEKRKFWRDIYYALEAKESNI